MNIPYKLSCFYDKFLSKDYYYLILMTVYHVEILVMVTFLGITGAKTHTFMPMIGMDEINGATGSLSTVLNYHFSFTNFTAVMLTIIIVLLDFIFLYIIKSEIKHHENTQHKSFYFKLTTPRIFIIEFFVLLLSMGNPVVRAMLYFMSFNTFQIYAIYRLLFKLKIFNPIIILGVYIAIIELLFYPIWILAKLMIWGVHT